MTAAAVYVLSHVQDALVRLHRNERAQDAFEYLLVIGGISVAIVLAMVTPIGHTLINAVISGVCTAIQGVVSSVVCTGV